MGRSTLDYTPPPGATPLAASTSHRVQRAFRGGASRSGILIWTGALLFGDEQDAAIRQRWNRDGYRREELRAQE